MTTDEIYTAFTDWLSEKTGVIAIRGYQNGDRPPGKYLVVNPPIIREVREHHRDVIYTEVDGEVSAAPIIEKEWDFTVKSYRETPEVNLELIQNLARIDSPQNNINRLLTLFDVGSITVLPEYINNKYEERAQMRVQIRGLTMNGFPIDVIEVSPVTVNRV